MRIHCPELDDLPDRERIDAMVTPQQHVVLEFDVEPWAKVLDPVRAQLERRHPRLSVFRGGPASVTLKYQIPSERILAHRDALEAAIARFTTTAQTLVGHVAAASDINETDINESLRFVLETDQQRGTVELDGESWSYWFHGFECQFVNHETGSTLDVRLKDWGRDGALLDPYFVGVYLHTTPEYEHLAALLPDEYHDTRRALMLLFS